MMIRVLTAHTGELDDVPAAVAEVLAGLEPERRLLRNSVGIMAFYPEFSDTGVVKALSEALPFDSIGMTTAGVSVPGAMGDIMLTLTVLTSDDVLFRAGASSPVSDDPGPPVRELYTRLASSLPGKPSLLLAFPPVLDHLAGDDFIDALDALSGGVPVFGSLPFTPAVDFSGIHTCFNGERHADALALIALHGDVRPRFFISRIPDDRVVRLRHDAIITEANGNGISRINGIAPLPYLNSLGLAENGRLGTGTFPLLLTLEDGTRIVRTMYKLTEDGVLISHGRTPAGAKIAFFTPSAEFILESVAETLTRAAETSGARNALVFSCIGRRWLLGARVRAEAEKAAACLDASTAYSFIYSGGEICPTRNLNGIQTNCFHNFSLIACFF
jgi:hypothetical protein